MEKRKIAPLADAGKVCARGVFLPVRMRDRDKDKDKKENKIHKRNFVLGDTIKIKRHLGKRTSKMWKNENSFQIRMQENSKYSHSMAMGTLN